MGLENVTKKKIGYMLPVLLGMLCCFYYLYLAADNVVYSDYIRLINSYLPDVGNPEKFFVPDILTRVPITYLGRVFNVKWFGYNTFFDMSLGVLSFALGAAALSAYAVKQKKISFLWFLAVMAIYFSLNKWEMLINGTGWVCFLSLSGFYYHFIVLDRVISGKKQAELKKGERNDRTILLFLPSILTCLVAGPYCGSYCAILLFVYLVLLCLEYKDRHHLNHFYVACFLSVLIPLFLYLWSNSYAVYVHRGATDASLFSTVVSDPLFFVRFLLKAFASSLLGAEQITSLSKGGSIFGQAGFIYLLGFFVILLYGIALFLNWSHRIYEETVLPFLLLLSGGFNHLLILSARWIFLNDSYGMSSRYEIQYQMGIIGIVLTFAIVWKEQQEMRRRIRKSNWINLLIGISIFVMLAGNFYTTGKEWETAPFRKKYLALSREIALNYKNASDEELKEYLHHDPNEIRKAMRILEENRLNIFRKR